MTDLVIAEHEIHYYGQTYHVQVECEEPFEYTLKVVVGQRTEIWLYVEPPTLHSIARRLRELPDAQ